VILGASGAGKSSLLKAGIIPRLRREAPAWLPLRAFRLGADPLLNFAEALALSLRDFGKVEAHGVIRDHLFDACPRRARWQRTDEGRACALETAFEIEGCKLRDAAGRGAASILISVDQAVEMARATATAARRSPTTFAPQWRPRHAVAARLHDPDRQLPELQGHRRFQDLRARGFDLRAMRVIRFESVVEEPAKRYSVAVDHALVDCRDG